MPGSLPEFLDSLPLLGYIPSGLSLHVRHQLLNTAAGLLAGWRRNSTERIVKPFQAQSVVAVETTHLGDVVAMLPALASIRRFLPAATVTVVVREECASFFDMFPAVDAVITVCNGMGPSDFLGIRRKLRKLDPDLMLSMSPSHLNAVLTLGLAPGAKAGYFHSYHSSAPFLFESRVQTIGTWNYRPVSARMQNIYRRASLVVESLGIPCDTNPQWDIPAEMQDSVSAELSASGFEHGMSFVVIHPFARWQFREWPLDRFLEVARRLTAESSSFIAFTGNSLHPRDTERLRKAILNDRGMAVLEAGDSARLAGILSLSNLFIGNDSGPLHLAASLGVPTIGLYGPAPPALTAPQSPLHQSLYVPIRCSPCEQQACVQPGKSCMPLITSGQVVDLALARLLPVDRPVIA
jgi:ADP-heptose:LPS heptosyltransferase